MYSLYFWSTLNISFKVIEELWRTYLFSWFVLYKLYIWHVFHELCVSVLVFTGDWTSELIGEPAKGLESSGLNVFSEFEKSRHTL